MEFISAVISLIIILNILAIIACIWKIFQKAGYPAWAEFIPFFNIHIFLKMIGRPLWWVGFLLVPFVNLLVLLVTAIELARSFGKSHNFGFGIFFLGFIFFPILALDDSRYLGPENTLDHW